MHNCVLVKAFGSFLRLDLRDCVMVKECDVSLSPSGTQNYSHINLDITTEGKH